MAIGYVSYWHDMNAQTKQNQNKKEETNKIKNKKE